MTPPAAITEALQRQKSLAGVKLDAYYKQLLELFEEIGVPESDWEGRLGNIWGHVVTTMQEVRKARRVDEWKSTLARVSVC